MSGETLPRRRRRPRWRLVLGLVAAFMLLPIAAGGGPCSAINGNVQEVEPGQLNRSAQINGAQLRGIIDIRSVINLRGGGPNDKWKAQVNKDRPQ